MNAGALRRRRAAAAWALAAALILAAAPLVAEEGAAPGDAGARLTVTPAETALAAGAEDAAADADPGFGARLKRFLNPVRVCPNCGEPVKEQRSLLMLAIGFVGQIVFASRFLVQWIASERRRTSYVPKVFWHLSIVGSLLLLSYAISIRAWPIILGQAFGCLVYGRNLMLIAKAREELRALQEQAGGGGSTAPAPDESAGGTAAADDRA